MSISVPTTVVTSPLCLSNVPMRTLFHGNNKTWLPVSTRQLPVRSTIDDRGRQTHVCCHWNLEIVHRLLRMQSFLLSSCKRYTPSLGTRSIWCYSGGDLFAHCVVLILLLWRSCWIPICLICTVMGMRMSGMERWSHGDFVCRHAGLLILAYRGGDCRFQLFVLIDCDPDHIVSPYWVDKYSVLKRDLIFYVVVAAWVHRSLAETAPTYLFD